ncbi:hypothetical protein D3C72_1663840 [compost metagenome]
MVGTACQGRQVQPVGHVTPAQIQCQLARRVAYGRGEAESLEQQFAVLGAEVGTDPGLHLAGLRQPLGAPAQGAAGQPHLQPLEIEPVGAGYQFAFQLPEGQLPEATIHAAEGEPGDGIHDGLVLTGIGLGAEIGSLA